MIKTIGHEFGKRSRLQNIIGVEYEDGGPLRKGQSILAMNIRKYQFTNASSCYTYAKRLAQCILVGGKHLYIISVQKICEKANVKSFVEKFVDLSIVVGSILLPNTKELSYFAICECKQERLLVVQYYQQWRALYHSFFDPEFFHDLSHVFKKQLRYDLLLYEIQANVIRHRLVYQKGPIYNTMRFFAPFATIYYFRIHKFNKWGCFWNNCIKRVPHLHRLMVIGNHYFCCICCKYWKR